MRHFATLPKKLLPNDYRTVTYWFFETYVTLTPRKTSMCVLSENLSMKYFLGKIRIKFSFLL